MEDETGKELTEKEILKIALEHISDACCFAFELNSQQGEAFAFMVDSLLKYGTTIYNDDSPIDASYNWEEYAESLFIRKSNKLEVIK